MRMRLKNRLKPYLIAQQLINHKDEVGDGKI